MRKITQNWLAFILNIESELSSKMAARHTKQSRKISKQRASTHEIRLQNPFKFTGIWPRLQFSFNSGTKQMCLVPEKKRQKNHLSNPNFLAEWLDFIFQHHNRSNCNGNISLRYISIKKFTKLTIHPIWKKTWSHPQNPATDPPPHLVPGMALDLRELELRVVGVHLADLVARGSAQHLGEHLGTFYISKH